METAMIRCFVCDVETPLPDEYRVGDIVYCPFCTGRLARVRTQIKQLPLGDRRNGLTVASTSQENNQ